MKITKPIFWNIVIVICLLVFFFLMVVMIRKNNECSVNPFVYGAKEVYTIDSITKIETHPMCSCRLGNFNFYFDDNGTYNEDPILRGYKP